MRSILKYQPLRQFSTNKLSQIISHTAQNLKQQQTHHYFKYEDIFFNLYSAHLARQKNLHLQIKKLDVICIMGEFPCRSIVEHFHATAKTYSEDYTVQTFVRLARAYKISQADNSSTADFSINRLFFTPAFQNLIEEYKYGLRKENAMSWDNAFLVAQCLIDIGYVDYEVFSILLNMVETKLNKKKRNSTQIRKFQMQKKDYYIARHQNTQQNLIEDTEFQAVLKMLSSKVRKHQIESNKKESLHQLQNQLSANEDSQTLYQSILESVSLIESYNQNLTKLIQGIITVRKQYRKMTQLSENKNILRNPEFNLELLELQEMLLLKKIISISDIKSPQKIENEELELKRVEEILISMIQPERVAFSPSELTDFLNTSFTQSQNKEAIRQAKLKEISDYGRAMATLSKFAEVSRRVYNAPDARSLISMKWQKTLLLWNKGGDESPQWRENLHAEKIFRRTFADLYQMIKRSYSLFMLTFYEAPLKYKLKFFESLTRLGYHSQLISLLENQAGLLKQKVQNYNNQEFFSLIKVLNQIGHKISCNDLKHSALKHLRKLYQESESEESKSIFSMQFCINTINFISQSFNVQSAGLGSDVALTDKTQVLYDNLIDKLTEQTKYYNQSHNFLTNDHLYEAYRILAIERPGDFKLSKNWFAKFNIDVNNKKQLKEFLYRKNPFYSILHELCDQYATSPISKEHPFIQTGFNQKGDLTAVLLCSSDQTSIDGQYVNGNTNAYIHRVKREYNISITPFSVNSLLDIDYEKLSSNREFSFKSKESIADKLKQLFKRDELHLLQFSQIFSNITLALQKKYKKYYMYAIVKFLNTLNQCVRLYNHQKDIFSFQLFRFRRYRLLVQLDTLKEDFNMIDKLVKEELEKMWQKQSFASASDFFKQNNNILSFIEAIQQLIITSVQIKDQKNEPFTKNLFEGKRFSIETFIENELDSQNVGIEFINPTTYVDKTFCPYSDWAEVLTNFYPLGKVKLSQSSNIVKILTKKFLPNANEQLTLLPFVEKSELRNRVQFNTNSLEPLKQDIESQQIQQNLPKVSENQLKDIKALLSFIHQIKMSKSQEELVEYILSFDFINSIQLKPSYKSNIYTLPRKIHAYFNYLESSNNKIYLESPNLEYLFNKLEQREEISQVFNARKQRRAEAKIEYRLAQISRNQLIEKCDKIDQEVIDKLKTFDRNVLDSVEEYKFLQNGLKMIKIEKDQRQLERVLNRSRYYYRNLDKDFIYVQGNLEKLLNIKRSKAERTLGLYKVLYKLGKAEVQLNEAEKKVLKKEASVITFRLQNKKDHLDEFSQKFNSLSIGDLSKADKDKLRLRGTDLSLSTSLPLSDLILELVNLLDPKVYENFEKSIVKKYYTSTKGIPEQIFSSGLNKEFTKLAHQEERQIINQHSKLNGYDIGIINEMIQTFKTESKTGKERFAQLYDSFNEDIQLLNESEGRVELITEYLAQKELEFQEDYDPKLVAQIKQREVMKLWNVLFKKSYQDCDSELIKKTVSKLCERIRIMGDTTPPFFGLLVIKILKHPQTDILSKQNLICSIAYFKTPINIDSEDIRVLGEATVKQEKETRPSSQKIIEQMGLISNKNLMEKLNKKVNMIL